MKNIFELEQKLSEVKAAYHEASQIESAPELAARSASIKVLSDAINKAYIKGANKCEGCDEMPFGMKRRAGCYEIGCQTCKDPTSIFKDMQQDNLRSQGETPDEAIANWNDRVFWLKPPEPAPAE